MHLVVPIHKLDIYLWYCEEGANLGLCSFQFELDWSASAREHWNLQSDCADFGIQRDIESWGFGGMA